MHHLGQKKCGCILRQPTDRRMLASFLHLLLCTVLLFVLHFAQAKETPHPKRNCNCSAKYCCSTVDGQGRAGAGRFQQLANLKQNEQRRLMLLLPLLIIQASVPHQPTYQLAPHRNRTSSIAPQDESYGAADSGK